MADDISLKDALGIFSQGVKSYALSQALNEANERVQNLKMSGIKETEQRVQLGQIAQGLVGEMIGLGASAADIEQARLNYTPKSYQSAEAAAIDSALSGKNQLRDIAEEQMMRNRKDDLSMEMQKEKFRAKLQKDLFAQQEKLKGMDLQREEMKANLKKGGELKQAQIDFESNASAALRNISSLEQTVKKVGNYESTSAWNPFSNPKMAAKLSQDLLDTAIAYAKIVDPTSVAREGEVETAKKYAIPAGLGISNEATLQALKDMRTKILERTKDRRKLSTMRSSDLQSMGSESPNGIDLKAFIKPAGK